MLKKFFFILLLILNASCDNDSDKNQISSYVNGIVGSWQLISTRTSTGGPAIETEVKHGGLFRFSQEGTFDYTERIYSSYVYVGNYTYSNDLLKLEYLTEEGKDVPRELMVILEKDVLVMTPSIPRCAEECSSVYRRFD